MPSFDQKGGDTGPEKAGPPSGPYYVEADRGSEQRKRSQRLVLVALLLVIAACVTMTHWPALSAQASSFDDEQYLHKNKLVQDPGWGSTWRFLSEVLTPSTVHGYYQPLAMISLMLDCAMGGRSDNLMVFHATSLLLHVLNTSLVIVLLYALFGKVWPAAIVGLLFGLHPLTVEPIPWISERKTLLASFFALWCLIAYVRYARHTNFKLFGACVIMYVLALMSKPTTTPLVVLLLLLDFWPLDRLNRRAVVEKIPLFIIMVVFAVITVISQKRTASVTMPGEYEPMRIPLILCHNIVFYLYKIVWPVNLSSHYPFPQPLAISDPMILAGVIGTCILIPTFFVSLRWTRAPLTGWVFFFVAILPTMGIIGFTNVIASDKYAYLPSLGLLMVLAWVLGRLWVSVCSSAVRRTIVIILIAVVGIFESVATRRYLAQWQDSERYYRYMLTLAPNAPSVHLNLANTVLKKDKHDEAIKHYRKAIALWSNYVEAHFNLGIALGAADRHAEAVKAFQTVLRLRKTHKRALFRLADALARSGQLDEALGFYREALEVMPKNMEVLNNFALALVKKGQIDEAVGYYKKSLEIKPGSVEVLNNLGNAYVKQRLFDQAVATFEEALHLDPKFAETHYNLASALKEMGRIDDAIVYYRQVLQLKPDSIDSHFGLGMALAGLKKYDEAVTHCEQAIQLDPDFARAYYQLGIVFFNQNRIDEAIEQFRQVLRIHPDDAEMHCNLGILLVRKGSIDEAVKEFRTAVRLDPSFHKAREQLEAALAKKSVPARP
jgi:tetratricopeptide (TPR) repeat protein